ncbi:hypothetical protein [Sphingomonas panni]|uniref:hypothetical protein n=1 Tax=Sphingomonas panni TaxID=237612 RepID=UPI001F5BD178|nr:hypothetical protein [Sphingomonas panni]
MIGFMNVPLVGVASQGAIISPVRQFSVSEQSRQYQLKPIFTHANRIAFTACCLRNTP